MINVIHHSEQVARKDYHDDGAEWIHEWIQGGCYIPAQYPKIKKPTFSEYRILVSFRNNPSKYRINKGEKYVRQFNNIDGDTFVFRMKSDLYNLANKYDLFPEV